jgi:site-specific recombinase XerD
LREREAIEQLQEILVRARAGEASRQRTGATFADAAEEWLRHGREERGLKPTTLNDYACALRTHLLPAFGAMALDAVTAAVIERRRLAWLRKGMTPRNANKQLAILHGIFKRASKIYGLVGNPAADVEKVRERHDSTRFDFYAPEEVWALTRAAGSEQDAAMYLTAAFTGLRRGELIALRWRDVDFAGDAIRVRASYVNGHLAAPKSGRGRVVPMVADVAAALARLSNRPVATGANDLVFPGELAATWTEVRFGGDSWTRVSAPVCGQFAFTTCAIPSVPSPSTGHPSCRSSIGWATPTSTRRCAICTTSRGPTTQRSSRPRSRWRAPNGFPRRRPNRAAGHLTAGRSASPG